MENFAKQLQIALQENKLVLSGEAIEKLSAYLELLQKWNRVFNLTAITDRKEMVYLHIIDSLLVKGDLKGKEYLDVGSGAGLPGIPLAIVNQHQQWTLLDKNSKKTRFLTQAVAELKLTNATVAQSNCEDFDPNHQFDCIISRAFSTIADFVKTVEHLLSPEGIILAMKGKYPQAELHDIPENFTYEVKKIKITGYPAERHLIRLSRKAQ